ncbi:hypothetical protein [Pleomorphovibrio marinus]|uniref:hypothetical protein n=1 Tax=Pleomorphovibrio marinus TaxID=2164132 RepID=UPI000E0C1DF5|nr:hypothetical protein [Pleomorphovibrio marinus]
MNYFNFKRRNLVSGPHLLGSLLLIAGLFVLISPFFYRNEDALERVIYVGLGAMILGLVVVSTYGGTLIDFSESRFKEYVSIGGYKSGKWTALPDVLSVKVISSSYISTNTPNGIHPTFSGKVTDYKTLIYSDAPTPVLSFVYSSRERAIQDAKHLASNLNAELLLNLPKRKKMRQN